MNPLCLNGCIHLLPLDVGTPGSQALGLGLNYSSGFPGSPALGYIFLICSVSLKTLTNIGDKLEVFLRRYLLHFEFALKVKEVG